MLARGRRVIGLLDPASQFERQALRIVSFPVLIASTVTLVVGLASLA